MSYKTKIMATMGPTLVESNDIADKEVVINN